MVAIFDVLTAFCRPYNLFLSLHTSLLAIIRAQRPRGTIYIHCSLGYSRSACIAAAFLLSAGLAATVEEAVQAIRRVRPEILMHDCLVTLLEEFLARNRKTDDPAPFFAPVVSREKLGVAHGCL